MKVEHILTGLLLPFWTNQLQHLPRERQSLGLPARGNKWQVGGYVRWVVWKAGIEMEPATADSWGAATSKLSFCGVQDLATSALRSSLCSRVPCGTIWTSPNLNCGLRLSYLGILKALQLKLSKKQRSALPANEPGGKTRFRCHFHSIAFASKIGCQACFGGIRMKTILFFLGWSMAPIYFKFPVFKLSLVPWVVFLQLRFSLTVHLSICFMSPWLPLVANTSEGASRTSYIRFWKLYSSLSF